MPEQVIKDKTAIVGIGWTAFSRNSGVTTMTLAAEASLKAIADAVNSIEERIAELKADTKKADAPQFGKTTRSEDDAFDNAALRNLFAPLASNA